MDVFGYEFQPAHRQEGNDEDINEVKVGEGDNFQFDVTAIQGYFKGKNWPYPVEIDSSKGEVVIGNSYTVDINKDVHSKYIFMKDIDNQYWSVNPHGIHP